MRTKVLNCKTTTMVSVERNGTWFLNTPRIKMHSAGKIGFPETTLEFQGVNDKGPCNFLQVMRTTPELELAPHSPNSHFTKTRGLRAATELTFINTRKAISDRPHNFEPQSSDEGT
ncbi:hypothetical protein TNCV_327611 [Trichonephila clavipes]|nr:hypothetical protein TNCV_327611 [Trichonephila clavipes]